MYIYDKLPLEFLNNVNDVKEDEVRKGREMSNFSPLGASSGTGWADTR